MVHPARNLLKVVLAQNRGGTPGCLFFAFGDLDHMRTRLQVSEEALQKMVERSNIPGRLRCNFHSTGVPEENLPPSVQQDLLRIAQEAMSNAVRHAKPTVVSVHLRCHPPKLVLEVTDNGSGIADSQAASREGFGFSNMRARAENIGAQLEVRSEAGRGTTIVVHVPMNF